MLPVFMSLLVYLEMHQLLHVLFDICGLSKHTNDRQICVMASHCLCDMLLQVEYLPVFWKQQHMLFFDAFSFSFPAFLQRIPFSLAAATTWTVVTYFPVGLAGEPSRYCALHHHA